VIKWSLAVEKAGDGETKALETSCAPATVPIARVKFARDPRRECGIFCGKAANETLLLKNAEPFNPVAQLGRVSDSPRANHAMRGLVDERACIPGDEVWRIELGTGLLKVDATGPNSVVILSPSVAQRSIHYPGDMAFDAREEAGFRAFQKLERGQNDFPEMGSSAFGDSRTRAEAESRSPPGNMKICENNALKARDFSVALEPKYPPFSYP